MALAQGSGELIWWPYLIAKYGLAFLFLLLPACLLQYPLNYQIGQYTLLTGETIFQGFMRLSKPLALFLWILLTLSFLWFGAFASAGGTALAALTHFPQGWSEKGQTLFWAYGSIALFFSAIALSKVIYTVIEKVMMGIALITVVGLLSSSLHPKVIHAAPVFIKAIFIPAWPPMRPWESQDATKLLTAITFAGLGGFWTLFYSYWLREKGVGMSRYMGHVTGILGKKEVLLDTGFIIADDGNSSKEFPKWRRFLLADSAVGIFGNIFTTLLTCLLAFALLHPEGLLPDGYELAVVQSRFFEVSWGAIGKILFLFVAAAFLSDTWLTTVDAVSRIHTDFVYGFFPKAKRIPFRTWYYFFLVLLTVVTSLTMTFEAPGPLILLSAVIGFIGTVIFSIALLFLNHRMLAKELPPFARPGKWALALMSLTCVAYLVLAITYLKLRFFP
ncbi:MAG: Nramp family divalent metal transporter [Candidatus Omnitrophica bacterium]|nr:Nramp family divalent metal transporter [Candidatus Omnitrophota bacterium]